MSMSGLNTFTALVKSGQDDGFHFLVCQDGNGTVLISAFRYGVAAMILVNPPTVGWSTRRSFWWSFGCCGGFHKRYPGRPYHYGTAVKRDRSRFWLHDHGAVRMQFPSSITSGAIDENFVKQAVDEGNMLAALFGQESFTGD